VLQTLEALSFPFQDGDSLDLLDTKLPSVCTLLMQWTKGDIQEAQKTKQFVKSSCITSIEIHPEQQVQEDHANAFSLALKNRL